MSWIALTTVFNIDCWLFRSHKHFNYIIFVNGLLLVFNTSFYNFIVSSKHMWNIHRFCDGIKLIEVYLSFTLVSTLESLIIIFFGFCFSHLFRLRDYTFNGFSFKIFYRLVGILAPLINHYVYKRPNIVRFQSTKHMSYLFLKVYSFNTPTITLTSFTSGMAYSFLRPNIVRFQST